jgi:hypothetical protein
VISRPALTLGLTMAVAVAGCGPGGKKDSSGRFKGEARLVANTVEDLQSAGKRREGDRICTELLAASLVRSIRTASRRSCVKAVKDAVGDADTFELTVERVTVTGATATVMVRSGDRKPHERTDTLGLVKEGKPARWKIARLGS